MSATIEDTNLNNPPEDLPELKEDDIDLDNIKKFFRLAKKAEIAEQIDDDQQRLLKSAFAPTPNIVDIRKSLPDQDSGRSYDQVRLIQLANANYRKELGKYNNISKESGMPKALDELFA